VSWIEHHIGVIKSNVVWTKNTTVEMLESASALGNTMRNVTNLNIINITGLADDEVNDIAKGIMPEGE